MSDTPRTDAQCRWGEDTLDVVPLVFARQLERELAEARKALRELVSACAYVKPIAGAVAVEAKVSYIREAGKFMSAVQKAKEVLGE